MYAGHRPTASVGHHWHNYEHSYQQPSHLFPTSVQSWCRSLAVMCNAPLLSRPFPLHSFLSSVILPWPHGVLWMRSASCLIPGLPPSKNLEPNKWIFCLVSLILFFYPKIIFMKFLTLNFSLNGHIWKIRDWNWVIGQIYGVQFMSGIFWRN